MSSSQKILGGVVALVLALVLVAIGFLFLRGDGPEELSIGDRVDESGEVVESEASNDAVVGDVDIVGAWTLTGDSVAGYRVVEDFVGGVADFEAVGRTSMITGDLTIDGTSVTEASFSVDVASITSGDGQRDNQFTGPIMNAAEFPTSDFVLTSPIDLGSVPANGEVITTNATGTLTLRDATVEVTFPLEASLVGSEVQVAGSIDVLFSDYGIDNPSNAFVSVRDEGVVEFSLFFTQV